MANININISVFWNFYLRLKFASMGWYSYLKRFNSITITSFIVKSNF